MIERPLMTDGEVSEMFEDIVRYSKVCNQLESMSPEEFRSFLEWVLFDDDDDDDDSEDLN